VLETLEMDVTSDKHLSAGAMLESRDQGAEVAVADGV
jgi:hypothetical protein